MNVFPRLTVGSERIEDGLFLEGPTILHHVLRRDHLMENFQIKEQR